MKRGIIMSKKIIAIIISALLAISIIPFAAFAEEGEVGVVSAETRAAAWNANYGLVIKRLLDDHRAPHWEYVDQNSKSITNTMTAYTVFALYDDAWQNGFDKSVSIDTAEKVLISLIERVDTGIGDSKFEEIYKVLQTASDMNDLLQKVNGFIKISDTLTSEEWTKAFKYINNAIKLYKMYDSARDDVIEMYARLLSVQAANDFYLDFLQFIVSNCSYDVICTAAANLIDDINKSIEDLVEDELAKLALSTGTQAIQYGITLAMNTNAYTAVALKVYQVGTSVADVLWNTSDQYVLMDELYTTYFAEQMGSYWATIAKDSGDDDWYEFAIYTILSLREVGCETLYDLKTAQNEGLIGKISNQINYNIGFEYVCELAFLELARDVLCNIDLSKYLPINSIVTISSNAYVHTSDVSLFNQQGIFEGANGFYSVYFNDSTEQYVKTIFLSNDDDINIRFGSDVFATMIIEKNAGGGIADYSFTNETIALDKEVTFNTADTTYSVITEGVAETKAMNDDFVYPPYNEVTASSVAQAAGDVIVSETRAKVIEIKDLLDQIFTTIKNFFKTLFTRNKD
jgi:hypothetical protein